MYNHKETPKPTITKEHRLIRIKVAQAKIRERELKEAQARIRTQFEKGQIK